MSPFCQGFGGNEMFINTLSCCTFCLWTFNNRLFHETFLWRNSWLRFIASNTLHNLIFTTESVNRKSGGVCCSCLGGSPLLTRITTVSRTGFRKRHFYWKQKHLILEVSTSTHARAHTLLSGKKKRGTTRRGDGRGSGLRTQIFKSPPRGNLSLNTPEHILSIALCQ